MQGTDDDGDDPVDAAAELAREVAADLDGVLVTIYPDADALDTIRPGDADVETANAVAKAVGGAMAEGGVEAFGRRTPAGDRARRGPDRDAAARAAGPDPALPSPSPPEPPGCRRAEGIPAAGASLVHLYPGGHGQ